jgi:hypothetical protein
MANLWRTQRPRFPHYQSDGFGRDFYIKYTNGGYWDDQFILTKKPDYERPHYKNYHTLYHLAAPFKYWGDGSGRENYILKCNGFHHDQKPLCSYQLTDFLRNDKDIKGNPYNFRKKLYLSVSETKYNQKLKDLEKKLVKRLYTEPMKQKKKRIQIIADDSKDELFNNNDVPNYCKTSNNFNKKLEGQNNKDDIIKENIESNKNSKNRNISLDSNNWEIKYRKKINSKFYNSNKSEERKYDKTYYGNFDHKKAIAMRTINYISPKNNLKFIDNRGKYCRSIRFKQPLINERVFIKKIKFV